jgi:hypothetical protein
MGLFERKPHAGWRGVRILASLGLVAGALLVGSGPISAASAAGQKNAGDIFLDNVGQPPPTGHEHDPHLACADINLWGNGLADSSGTYTIDGWPPSGSMEQVYSASWTYNTALGGNQVTSVINVTKLIAAAVAAGDMPVNKQGFHFKLQFVQDPQKHKTFWVKCPVPPKFNAFVGYADTLRGNGTPSTPTPWKGSPNVTFVGCGFFGTDICRQQGGHDVYDAGAIRLDNVGTVPFTVTDASVVTTCTFTPWSGLNVTVQPGHTLILTETGGTPPAPCIPAPGSKNNFDTSENGTKVCTNNGVMPKITFSINGSATTMTDTNQILNTGGFDKFGCLSVNEGHAWSAL